MQFGHENLEAWNKAVGFAGRVINVVDGISTDSEYSELERDCLNDKRPHKFTQKVKIKYFSALSLACPVKCFVETSEADLTGELSALSYVQLLNNLTNFGGLMKKAVLIVVVVMMTAAGVMAAEENRQQPGDDYILGPGDVLDISVWKVEELTKMVTVLPDGRIAFPLIGQITAGGKTVDELSRELEKKLIKFVPDLNLTVMVQQVNSMMIYVIGEVHNPGRFILNSNINVLQALALAGGLDTFAKAGKIKIFREAGKGTEIIGYDYEEVTEGNELGQNILLKRGDVIFVP